jgi:D-alanine-D-alanine ligase
LGRHTIVQKPAKLIRVGVLFGGRSGEHEVSLSSAASVIRALDPAKYEAVPIGITKDGRWLVGANAHQLLGEVLKAGQRVMLSADPSVAALVPLGEKPGGGLRVDVIFPVLHGTFGEDGTVQGLLELAGLPYVGAGVLASAVGMDKDVQKRLFREAGIPVGEFVAILRSEWEQSRGEVIKSIAEKFEFPVFVKPAALGSSVGMSKVHSRQELPTAMDLAAEFAVKIVVERGFDAREIEVAVLGNDKPRASVPSEIVPHREFYDYTAKYLEEGTKYLTPAPLKPAQTKKFQDYAIQAFRCIDCAGMARVDFFLERKTGKMYLNEINTIPGFTSISQYPKMWAASGVPYRELIDHLIQLALDAHAQKARTKYAIELPPGPAGALDV